MYNSYSSVCVPRVTLSMIKEMDVDNVDGPEMMLVEVK